MKQQLRARFHALLLASCAATVAACASDGGTDPVVVTSVVITAPATAPTFQTLTRTAQFAAEPRDASNQLVTGAGTTTWSSTDIGVATVSGAGLVRAVGNGTAEIRATIAGVQSAPTTVTVAQVADATVITPGSVTFGAIGSTRQLLAGSVDSAGVAIPGTLGGTWTSAGPGTFASVSATGLVTALAVGTGDTAIATIGTKSAKAAITVTQVPASVLVSSTGSDTLATTGRQKTYTATVRDSQLNTIPGAGVTWSSTTPATATVDAGGVATAVFDGPTNIRATSGAVFGQKALTVLRFSVIFALNPTTASISTNGGTTPLSVDNRDSVDTVLPTSWSSRSNAIATVSPTLGANVNATATGNGMVFIIVSAARKIDSVQLTVSNQVTLNTTATVTIGDNFFRSVRNNTQNEAIDTIAAGGTVTWNWTGSNPHTVDPQGTPTFPAEPGKSSGNAQRTFANVGTYQYFCLFHGNMTGRVVVR